jgi:hypothetical protein
VVKQLIKEQKWSLDTFVDEERMEGNSSVEGVYLGDDIYK